MNFFRWSWEREQPLALLPFPPSKPCRLMHDCAQIFLPLSSFFRRLDRPPHPATEAAKIGRRRGIRNSPLQHTHTRLGSRSKPGLAPPPPPSVGGSIGKLTLALSAVTPHPPLLPKEEGKKKPPSKKLHPPLRTPLPPLFLKCISQATGHGLLAVVPSRAAFQGAEKDQLCSAFVVVEGRRVVLLRCSSKSSEEMGW